VGGLGLSSLPPLLPLPPDVGSGRRGDAAAAAAAVDGSWNLRLQYLARIQASSTLQHQKGKLL
jgi:hypothetical protein